MTLSSEKTPAELPIVAVMIGDPAGIGPEVCVKALASGAVDRLCHPVLIGDVEVIRQAAGFCKLALPVTELRTLEKARLHPGVLPVLDPGGFDFAALRHGQASAASGEAVLAGMALGYQLGQRHEIQGLVLGPVNSASMKATGKIVDIDELQPPGTYMLRLAGALRVVPLSEHLPLQRALEAITPEAILALLRLLDATLRNWGFPRPRIAVAGINPHALFEDDQARVLPAVLAAQREGIAASGPVAPDSVFRMALAGQYEAIVTMFHDQGQIAIKTVGFAGACTVYIGLPYVLLNVPHGTAFDIAGQGVAQHLSMLAALKTAAELAAGRGPTVMQT